MTQRSVTFHFVLFFTVLPAITLSPPVYAGKSGAIQRGPTAGNASGGHIRYSDDFASNYPQIVTTPPDIGADTLDPPLILQSVRKSRTATLLQSGLKVPYEKQVAVITIESAGGRKRFLVFRSFRAIDMKWVNDRLLYFDVDVGHIAGIQALFDAETGRWLYRQSVEYFP